jgi:TetR/AcrR family transcriptional regulator, transcriptional repressor for nem operon
MIATRDEIIGLADQLIRSKGFNAFSYSDISAAMDVRNAAIHYHFPSKSALGISVIDEELARIATSRQEWAHLPGDEQIKRIMQGFFDKSRKGMICLTGSLTPDYETFSPDMQLKVVEMCEAILGWLGNFHGKAPDRALLLMSTLVSSLLLSRILGPDIFDRMIDQILKDLGTSPAKWEEKSADWLL